MTPQGIDGNPSANLSQQPYMLGRNNTKDLDVITDVDSEESKSLEETSLVN